jgi:hypothetical protein
MPVYAAGKSPEELMDRLPYLRLKELSGDGMIAIKPEFKYDSYEEGVLPQYDSKNLRGTIYVTGFKGSFRRDTSSTYEISFHAETLDWIHSAFLQRNKRWELTYGWTDDNLTLQVETTTIDVKFDPQHGGFALTLGLVTDGLDMQYSITPQNATMQKGIQGNKKSLDIETVLTTYLGEAKNLFGIAYTYESAALVKDFQFSPAEVNMLLKESGSSFMSVFQNIIVQYGMRVKFDSDKKTVSIVSNELPPNPDDAKWIFEYKSFDTDILEIDFTLVVQEVNIDKVNESLFVLRPSGETEPIVQEITGSAETPKEVTVVEEVYSAGDENSYIFSRKNFYLPPIRVGTIKIIGNPHISFDDVIEIRGMDDLSGNYRVNVADQEVSISGYITTLRIVGPNEEV